MNCVCKNSGYRIVYNLKYPAGTQIAECLSCGLCRTLPIPADSKLKVSDYFREAETEPNIHKKIRLKAHKKLLKVIRRSKAQDSLNILDVGCSTGRFVDYSGKSGIRSFGVDIDYGAVQYGYNGLGIRNLCIAQATALPFAKDCFDAVVLYHVLEHFPLPLEALSQIRAVLKRDGLLLIILPNYKGLISRIRPLSWQGWRPEIHYWHFSPWTLNDLLKNSGFEPVKFKSERMHTPLISSIIKRIAYEAISRFGNAIGMGDEIFLTAQKAAA